MLDDEVNRILIDTGNIINLKEFKKKATLSPTDEVLESVKLTFSSWLNNAMHKELSCLMKKKEQENSVFCKSPNHIKVIKSDRQDLKISVKVFLTTLLPEDLNQAITQVMNELDVEIIDSLIVALPPWPNNKKFDLVQTKPIWNELEKFIDVGGVSTIGISDLDTEELIELYNWTKVKPSINQVNLDSCCVMPPDMIAFAKDNDIQLLTHNDPKVLLPEDSFKKILEYSVSSPSEWELHWIVRYSVFVKCRGIIQNKGYLLCTKRKEI